VPNPDRTSSSTVSMQRVSVSLIASRPLSEAQQRSQQLFGRLVFFLGSGDQRLAMFWHPFDITDCAMVSLVWPPFLKNRRKCRTMA
jgi:hypothetical protein